MKYIKKLVYSLFMIALHQSVHGQFDSLMHEFSHDFQEFARVYLHGTKEEKKDLYSYTKKSITSALNLQSYVKNHPHEKRSVPKEQRELVEKTVNSLPKPTVKKVEQFQSDIHELNRLIARYMSSSKSIPHDLKDKNYKKSILNSVEQLKKLNDFITKKPGLMMNEQQKKRLIAAVENLKKMFPEAKNMIKKHDQNIKNKIKSKVANKADLQPTTKTVKKPVVKPSAATTKSYSQTIVKTSDASAKKSAVETKKDTDAKSKDLVKNTKKDTTKKKPVPKPVATHHAPAAAVAVQPVEPVYYSAEPKSNKK